MKLFHDGLVGDETSGYFQVTNGGDVQITMIGTFNSVGITMELSPDHETWTDYLPDGVAIEFSADGEQRLLKMQPGYYRFVAESDLTGVDIYVDGKWVRY